MKLLTPSRVLLCTLAFLPSTSAAQEARRLELGAQISALQLEDPAQTNTGIGGRLGWQIARWGAVEAEVNYFANDRFEQASTFQPVGSLSLRYERRRVEVFAGPKIGFRGQRVGLFAKARPGFTRLTHKGVRCTGEVCALVLIARPEYKTEFALDLGGVVEFYPTGRSVLRGDVGTRMIRHRSAAPPCSDCSTQNFTSSIGIGFRF